MRVSGKEDTAISLSIAGFNINAMLSLGSHAPGNTIWSSSLPLQLRCVRKCFMVNAGSIFLLPCTSTSAHHQTHDTASCKKSVAMGTSDSRLFENSMSTRMTAAPIGKYYDTLANYHASRADAGDSRQGSDHAANDNENEECPYQCRTYLLSSASSQINIQASADLFLIDKSSVGTHRVTEGTQR